jgi:hypothetical protein
MKNKIFVKMPIDLSQAFVMNVTTFQSCRDYGENIIMLFSLSIA